MVQETEVQETEVQETEVQETEVQETEVQETEVQETEVQETESPEIHTIKLGERLFSAESLTEHANNLLGDLKKIDSVLGQQTLLVSITQLAKAKIVEEIEKESVHFTEVFPEDTPDTPDTPSK